MQSVAELTVRERDVLGKVLPYSALNAEQLDRLGSRCGLLRLASREVLLHDGSPVTHAYILVTGYLMRSICSPDGVRMLLNDTHPVTAFGCAAALHAEPHIGVVEAASASEIITIPLDVIQELLEESPAFALAVARSLARSSVRQTEFLCELLFPVPVRVARFLCRRCNGGEPIELEMSKGALAEMMATVPETLSRALGTLRSHGLVEVSGRSVRVLDERGLRLYAQL